MSFRLLSPRFGLGVLVAVVTAIHASAVHTEFIDDAYISFRYSWHLAHGNGLTFNVGDPVEGYSNLTWVWLGAAVIKLGIPLEPGIKCLAVAFLAATPVFLYALLLRLGATLPHAAVTALLLASMTSWVVPMVNGLEGALFSFLLLVVTSLTWRNSTAASRTVVIASGLAGFLLAATRPEGAALYLSQLGVALIFCAAYRNKVGWRAHLLSLATFLAAIGVLTAWRLATYGSMLPNTVIAKMNRQSRIFSRIVLSVSGDGFQYCLAFFFETLPVWLLIGMGTLWMWRLGSSSEAKPRSLLAVLAAVVPPLAFILVLANNGDWMPHFRLLAPILPLLVLIAGALLIGSPRWTLVAFAAATIASVSPRNLDGPSLRHVIDPPRSAVYAACRLGADVQEAAKASPRRISVASEVLGIFSYCGPMVQVRDLNGLTDSRIAWEEPSAGTFGRKTRPATLEAMNPDAVVLSDLNYWRILLDESPWFAEHMLSLACDSILSEHLYAFVRDDSPLASARLRPCPDERLSGRPAFQKANCLREGWPYAFPRTCPGQPDPQ